MFFFSLAHVAVWMARWDGLGCVSNLGDPGSLEDGPCFVESNGILESSLLKFPDSGQILCKKVSLGLEHEISLLYKAEL